MKHNKRVPILCDYGASTGVGGIVESCIHHHSHDPLPHLCAPTGCIPAADAVLRL